MKVLGKLEMYERVEIKLLDALYEIKEEFLNTKRKGSSRSMTFKYNAKEHNGKYVIIETRDIWANKAEDIIFKTIIKEEYEYFLALNKVIEFHENKTSKI